MMTFVLFGKSLFRDGELDWFGKARCDLAADLLKDNPKSTLIISGAKKGSTRSEASAMRDYIINLVDAGDRILLEETGLSTVNQLIVIKNSYLIPRKWFEVGLVTDEIHMLRVKLLATHLLGDDFHLTEHKAEVRISAKYRQVIEDLEKELCGFVSKNPVLTTYPKGDDKAWQIWDEFYRNKNKGQNAVMLDVNEEFLKYIKSVYK